MRRGVNLWFFLMALLVAGGLLFAACAPDEAAVPDEEPEPEPTDEVTEEEEPEPVLIRIFADFLPPPFNAGIAMEQFAQDVEERIPGSEVRTYYAGSLYPTESEALEAMVPGNLEMIFGMHGKAAGFEPWMNIITQPMAYTTIGALRNYSESETAEMLRDRMATRGIEILDYAHLSFYMAIASQERILHPDDLAGMRIRSMDPIVGNTVLEAWGASAVTMAFGEVPTSLETGVLDAVSTSVGGYLALIDQAPYFNVKGVSGLTNDVYYIGASREWWEGLNEPTREILTELVSEMAEYSDQLTYCDDQAAIRDHGTDDPNEPGLYMLAPEEIEPFRNQLGDAPAEALVREIPDAEEWIYRFVEEGIALSEEHPEGTHPLEDTDCEPLWPLLERD